MPSPRVLIVDDDEGVREFLREALAGEGYEVNEAVDGQDALDQLARSTPHVILLDLMMPRLDGWEFRAKQQTMGLAMEVPIIVLSAGRRIEEVDQLGAAAIIAKPFELHDLLTAVDSLSRREAD